MHTTRDYIGMGFGDGEFFTYHKGLLYLRINLTIASFEWNIIALLPLLLLPLTYLPTPIEYRLKVHSEHKYEYAGGNWIVGLLLYKVQGQVSEMGSLCDVLHISLTTNTMDSNMDLNMDRQLGFSI